MQAVNCFKLINLNPLMQHFKWAPQHVALNCKRITGEDRIIVELLV